MSIPKLCLRLAVFLCTLTIALFVTRLFLIPPRVEVRVAAPALPPAVDVAPEPMKVNFKVQQVVLDRAHAKTYVQLIVERDPYAPVPEYLWVSVWLFTPPSTPSNKRRYWYLPFEDVPQPFARGDRATVTVVFLSPSGSDPAELANNLYAQVCVSPFRAYNDGETSLNSFSYYNTDSSPAIPVVVEHKQKR